MRKMNREKRKGRPIARILCASLVFLPAVLYAFLLQTILDRSPPNGGHLSKALLFISVLIIGSASYDWAKRILFMDHKSFGKFVESLLALFICIVMYFAFFIAANSMPDSFPIWFSIVLFLASAAYLFAVIKFLGRAIEVGVKAREE
jgi:protein-S-isoprenylcysteine O-methyltransferase Ste14